MVTFVVTLAGGLCWFFCGGTGAGSSWAPLQSGIQVDVNLVLIRRDGFKKQSRRRS